MEATKEVVPSQDAEKQREEEKQKEKAKRQQINQDIQNNLINSTKELFSNVEKYLQGEITATSEDYKLLETMNNMTKEKYTDMTNTAHGLVEYMTLLQQKYTEFQPYLNKIDEIEASVNELEKTVILLDQYTLRLEEKFKALKLAGKLPYKKETTAAQLNSM